MSRQGNTLIFRGKTGEQYYFQVLPIDAPLKAVGGVYIVTRRTYEDRTFPTKANHRPLAIGHTADLSTAISSAAELARLRERQANCICVCPAEDERRRIEIEQDVLDGNTQWLEQLHYLGSRK